MGSEDQALTVHSKKGRRNSHHSKGNKFHHKYNIRKDLSILRFYTCDERGHFTKDCPRNKVNSIRRRETREDIMLMLQRMMNHPRRDPNMKVKILQARMNMF